MFFSLIVFVASLIIEAIIVLFLSPENPNGTVNHLFIILFSINTGVVFGSFYSLILILVYWFMKAYDDIRQRSFIRRAVFFGIFVAMCVLLKLYGILDIYITLGMLIVIVSLEFILTRKD